MLIICITVLSSLQLSAYISCCKFPPPSELPELWRKSLTPLMDFLKSTVQGNVDTLPRSSVVEVLLYVHRNRRLIRDGSPGWPPPLSHSSWSLTTVAVVDCFYIVLLSTLRQTHCILVVAHDSKWLTVSFYSVFGMSIAVVYSRCCLVVIWLVPPETAVVLVHSLYTIQPGTASHHFMHGRMHRVHECLALTCHLHFWQNDQDLLCATGVT